MSPSSTDTQQVERDIEGQGTSSAEQAADLAALRAAAAPVTATGAAAPEQQVQQGPSAAALQVAELAVGMLRPVICFAVPSLRAAPGELWAPIPAGVAGILDHYEIGMDALKNPWARLAMACAPLGAYAAVQAMKEQQEQPKPDPTEGGDMLNLESSKQDANPQTVGQKTVTFGAPA